MKDPRSILILTLAGLLACSVIGTKRAVEQAIKDNAEIKEKIKDHDAYAEAVIQNLRTDIGLWQSIAAERGRKLDIWETKYTNTPYTITTNIYLGGKLVTNGEIKLK